MKCVVFLGDDAQAELYEGKCPLAQVVKLPGTTALKFTIKCGELATTVTVAHSHKMDLSTVTFSQIETMFLVDSSEELVKYLKMMKLKVVCHGNTGPLQITPAAMVGEGDRPEKRHVYTEGDSMLTEIAAFLRTC